MRTGLQYKDEDGLLYDIKVDAYNAIYPDKHRVIKVQGEVVNKEHQAYRKVKQDLGDDWLSDITNTWWFLDFPMSEEDKFALQTHSRFS
jgi:hypothetical protein